MLSFAFRNPDQSVTSYNKAFRGHRNVAKGNQFCQMRVRYIGESGDVTATSIREVYSSGVRSIGVWAVTATSSAVSRSKAI